MKRLAVFAAMVIVAATPGIALALMLTSGSWQDPVLLGGHAGDLAGNDFALSANAAIFSNHSGVGPLLWSPGQRFVHAIAIGTDLIGAFTYHGSSFNIGCVAPELPGTGCSGSASVEFHGGPFSVPPLGASEITLSAPFTVIGDFTGYGVTPQGWRSVASADFSGAGLVTIDLVPCSGGLACWDRNPESPILYQIGAVPEPSTLLLALSGLVGLGAALRRHR